MPETMKPLRHSRLSQRNSRLSQLQKRLRRKMGAAIADYGLIEEGDEVLVALSGGKDSWAMLDLLLNLSLYAPVRFTVCAATVDGGFPSFNPGPIQENCASLGVHHVLLPAPIMPVLGQFTVDKVDPSVPGALRHRFTCEPLMFAEQGSPRASAIKPNPGAKPKYTPCAMCSRLRRGVLYSYMRANGFSKLALGHHLDDILETLLMNLFFEGRLSTMPLKLLSNDGAVTVIRPLGTCDESDMREYAKLRGYPLVPSGCPLGYCSSPLSKRVQMKELISELNDDSPDLRRCMLRAITNVKTTHLLDKKLLELPPEWAK